MLERAERISFKLSSVLSKVEPQPDIRYTPASAPTKKYRLRNTGKEPQKTNKKNMLFLLPGLAENFGGHGEEPLQDLLPVHLARLPVPV